MVSLPGWSARLKKKNPATLAARPGIDRMGGWKAVQAAAMCRLTHLGLQGLRDAITWAL